jgi:flavoprotein
MINKSLVIFRIRRQAMFQSLSGKYHRSAVPCFIGDSLIVNSMFQSLSGKYHRSAVPCFIGDSLIVNSMFQSLSGKYHRSAVPCFIGDSLIVNSMFQSLSEKYLKLLGKRITKQPLNNPMFKIQLNILQIPSIGRDTDQIDHLGASRQNEKAERKNTFFFI